MNCHYCKIAPFKIRNIAQNKPDKYKNVDMSSYTFVYNGLDRVDSSKSHTLDNVVPCCKDCNTAKLDKPLNKFLAHMKNLYSFKEFIWPKYDLSITSPIEFSPRINYIMRDSNYNDGNLSVKDFIAISQHPCAYCGAVYSNINEYKVGKFFLYNGLDRIDSKKTHTLDNVVACCISCNTAKLDRTLDQFICWVNRFEYLKNIEINYTEPSILGLVFGNLTVTKSDDICSCICSCGKEIHVKKTNLINNHKTHCGCLSKKKVLQSAEDKRIKLEGTKINRWNIIKYLGYYKYLCKCDCGSERIVLSQALRIQASKSCGCLDLELKSQRAKDGVLTKNMNFNHRLTTAKSILYRFNRTNNVNVSLDDFLKQSQQDCYYCKSAPDNISGELKYEFVHNNISLLDDRKTTVTSCQICSRAKVGRSVEDFWKIIRNIRQNINKEYSNLDSFNFKIKSMYIFKKKWKVSYSDDLSLDDFFYYSQQRCFYCKSNPSSFLNKGDTSVMYNGVAKINMDEPLNNNNVVTCCKICKSIKHNFSHDQFITWINRFDHC